MENNKKDDSSAIRIENDEQIRAIKKTSTCPKCKKDHALSFWGGSKTAFINPEKKQDLVTPEWLYFSCKFCKQEFEINKNLYDSL